MVRNLSRLWALTLEALKAGAPTTDPAGDGERVRTDDGIRTLRLVLHPQSRRDAEADRFAVRPVDGRGTVTWHMTIEASAHADRAPDADRAAPEAARRTVELSGRRTGTFFYRIDTTPATPRSGAATDESEPRP